MGFYYSKVHQRSEDGKWRAAADVVDSAGGSAGITEFALDAIYDTEADAEIALAKELSSKGYIEIYTPQKVAAVVGKLLNEKKFKMDNPPAVSSELVIFLGTQGSTPITRDLLPKVPGWAFPIINCNEAFGIVGCKIEYSKIRQ
jgi:hypothetical protein